MANLTELFKRLEMFEQTQQELQSQKEEMQASIQSLRKEIKEVRGIP